MGQRVEKYQHPVKYRPPKDLIAIDPTAEHKEVVAKFTTPEMKRYRAFMEQLRDSTNGELTDIEYSNWALAMMWLDKFDAWAKDKNPDKIAVSLRDQERKYRGELLKMLERYRDKGPRTKSFLDQAKEFLMEIESPEGDLKIEWKKKDVIDVGEAPPQAKEEEEKEKGLVIGPPPKKEEEEAETEVQTD